MAPLREGEQLRWPTKLVPERPSVDHPPQPSRAVQGCESDGPALHDLEESGDRQAEGQARVPIAA